MPRSEDDASAAVFKALADPTRRLILHRLRQGELAAGQVSACFPISGPSISRHLSVLKGAGLVSERRQANRILYQLVPERVAATLGDFVADICPEGEPTPSRGKKKAKQADKGTAKAKRKSANGKEPHSRGTRGATESSTPSPPPGTIARTPWSPA